MAVMHLHMPKEVKPASTGSASFCHGGAHDSYPHWSDSSPGTQGAAEPDPGKNVDLASGLTGLHCLCLGLNC